MNILDLTIKELHEKLVSKELSAKELTEFYFNRIETYEDKLHAFNTVAKDIALKQAEEADQLLPNIQHDNTLIGIPGSIKDVIVTEGIISTGSSKILENYIPNFDATVVAKLKEQHSVILGKNNCDEFAMGSSNENSAYGTSKNPWDISRVPGGSSGGSAVAVAAGMSHFSLGTDTGGSVRQPASFCGVVGLKPTYGRISRYGLMAMASSLDQCGIFARRVDDVEQVLRVIEGKDEKDGTSSERPSKFKALNLAGSLKGISVGVPTDFFREGLDGNVKHIIKQSIDQLEKLGADIKEITLPNFEAALATYYIIMPAEVSSNMARYDGIRYGSSVIGSEKIEDLEELYKANRSTYIGEEVKRRIMLGTYVLSAGYYDQYYSKAQKVRQLIRQDFAKAFETVDIIAGPVAPNPAFKIGDKTSDPLTMYLEDIYTVPVNLAGLPGMSVPAGFAEVGGKKLPVGLHLIGKWWEDYLLFEVGRLFEQETEIYKLQPELNF